MNTASSTSVPTAKKKRMPALRSHEHHVAADGQHCIGQKCSHHQQYRCEKMHDLVGGAGNQVLVSDFRPSAMG